MSLLSNIDYPLLDLAALFLFVPFMAFGVYGLRRRFLNHDEWGLGLQAVVLLCVLFTVAFEIHAMLEELLETPVFMIFASLGMMAAAMALYGHIAVSFLSRLIVDIFLPGGDSAASQPRFGPAESLERLGDHQGALNEYYVLARIFPGRPEIMARIGSSLEALDEHNDAAYWFGRAMDAQKQPREALALLWRTIDILENRLKRTDLAAEACENYLRRFPQSAEAAAVQTRKTRLLEALQPSVQTHPRASRPSLERLEDNPIDSGQDKP